MRIELRKGVSRTPRLWIALSLGGEAFEVVLLDNGHKRLAAPLDRHRLGDDVIGAPPQ